MAPSKPVDVASETDLHIHFGRKAKQLAGEPVIRPQNMDIARTRFVIHGFEIGAPAESAPRAPECPPRAPRVPTETSSDQSQEMSWVGPSRCVGDDVHGSPGVGQFRA